MGNNEMIEAIAKRWFLTGITQTSPGLWERQPDQIKAGYRQQARNFWEKPSRVTDALERVRYDLEMSSLRMNKLSLVFGYDGLNINLLPDTRTLQE